MEGILVSGLELEMDQARVTLTGLHDQPGNCYRIFQAIASGGIIVDMIVQNISTGRPELSFSVPRASLERAVELTRQAALQINPAAKVVGEAEIAIIHVGGVGMRTHTGVARKMFGALASRGINVVMINTSEVRLSVVVEFQRGEEALACLQEVFPR
jgi:aspartate kinase